ncbi:hypothetical protein [Kordia sp.]|uniref:hypothetical protein n=1 Tax=Kordia sp. TaxID=1965332 RepID=UPI003D27012F
MKKKETRSLSLNKKSISNLEDQIKGKGDYSQHTCFAHSCIDCQSSVCTMGNHPECQIITCSNKK